MIPDGYKAIPGYEGRYYIAQNGTVCNADGHVIKPIQSKDGTRVELRYLGQRDRLLISDLLTQLYEENVHEN